MESQRQSLSELPLMKIEHINGKILYKEFVDGEWKVTKITWPSQIAQHEQRIFDERTF